MKKYKVSEKCQGFQGRLWEKDEIVDFPDDVVPPHHFVLVSQTSDVKKPVKDDPNNPNRNYPDKEQAKDQFGNPVNDPNRNPSKDPMSPVPDEGNSYSQAGKKTNPNTGMGSTKK